MIFPNFSLFLYSAASIFIVLIIASLSREGSLFAGASQSVADELNSKGRKISLPYEKW